MRELPTGQRGIPHTALHKNFQLDKESYHMQHYMRTSNRTKKHTTSTTTKELPRGQRIISHAALTFGAPDTNRVGCVRQQMDPPVNGDVFGGGRLVLLHMHDSYYSIV